MGKADDAIFAGGQDYDRGSHLACNHSQKCMMELLGLFKSLI